MKFLNDEWAPLNQEIAHLHGLGLITFKYIWALFGPGTFFYTIERDQPRVYETSHYEYSIDNFVERTKLFNIFGNYVNYDGKGFGKGSKAYGIYQFEGSRKISELFGFYGYCEKVTLVPLDRHPEKEAVRKRLIDRGTKFMGLQGSRYKYYSGKTANPQEGLVSRWGDSIKDRILIDTRHAPTEICWREPVEKLRGLGGEYEEECREDEKFPGEQNNSIEKSPKAKTPTLTDDQKLISTAMIPGFVLNSDHAPLRINDNDEGEWHELLIDNIHDIDSVTEL